MKNVEQLTESVGVRRTVGDMHTPVHALTYDSRTVGDGDCFFAVVGSVSDGHAYIGQAIERGARTVVCQTIPAQTHDGVCYVEVDDTNAAMAAMASAFYGDPSRELKLVGVTGTNGKTTIATLLCDLFERLGYKAGLISTVVYRTGVREIESTHTTPDTIRLNAMLREMADNGCQYCFMECSSHSIVQERIRGLHFAGGLFTNITHDHLDYHKTFAEYIRAKKLFFDNLPADAFAITNIDDRNGRVMVQNTRAAVRTLSLRSMADFRCKVVEMHLDGMLLRIDGDEVWVDFLGRFNASNLLTVYAAAMMLGQEKQQVLTAMSTLHPVSGRFEYIRAADGTTAVVDYAHTPDALENVIETIEEIRRPGQNLIVLCGCGGDRDRTKRPEMAQIAVKYATTAIFTSDNPRTEDPEAILRDMTDGLAPEARYLKIADRAEAIRTAVMLSRPGDIILLAGKGHETYQIIGAEKHHFDDREQVRKEFAAAKR
ncbi:MAG TPA: UDP-N-acetylmuramoyl-L-alanyl-D-glutamate--2,6-diaminopimelate ligase [Candidatus Alistipes excrementipullorum]|nr:UDP-N-acetylmuramoyl-L-alanyl-D-glutamate--2,6-diaminopimelate ligase [Candidatus Alistipes excrementipullorum]